VRDDNSAAAQNKRPVYDGRVARDDYSHLAGHRFPGGTTRVPYWMNRLWGDAVACEDDPSPYVHPVLVYYAAVQGSGIVFQDIFDLMDASTDSGIMVGEQRFRFAGPLEVEKDYEVDGGITDVVRKEGRRAGVFDIATFELCVREPGAEEPLAVSTTSFVFPRREAAA
jgi:hypothetical protein